MVNDTIADMLTRIRNAGQMKYANVAVLNTKMTREIARILKEEGYINDYSSNEETKMLDLSLKYGENKKERVITGLKRISKPGLRVYAKHDELPRVLNGTGEIIICMVNNNVAGVTILKKNGRERKICTLYVVEGYRKKHIATNMLEYAFKYLETTKPLITIADYKVPLFESIIKKYHWKLIQTMEEGYYNDFSREKVFNEHLYPD